jgi:hypothetical protein
MTAARQRWAPWVAVALATLGVLGLLVHAAAGVWAELGRRHDQASRLAALQAEADAAVAAASTGVTGMTGRGAAARLQRLEADLDGLEPDPMRLFEHFQVLADAVGVTLLGFAPDAAPQTPAPRSTALAVPAQMALARAVPPRAMSLQLRGSLAALGHFLHGIAAKGAALELVSLRLTAGDQASAIQCALSLRLHGRDSLQALAVARGRTAPDSKPLADGARRSGSGAAVAQPESPYPGGRTVGMAWADIPPDAFAGSASLLAVRPQGSAAVPAEAAPPLAAPERAPPTIRLTGMLRSPRQVMALIEVAGGGTTTLRQGDALPGSQLRLAGLGEAAVSLVDPAGALRVLRLDADAGAGVAHGPSSTASQGRPPSPGPSDPTPHHKEHLPP